MGSVVTHCCRREVPDANDLKNDRPVITGGLLSGAAPPALLLQTPLEVERCDEPRAVRPKTRTSFAAGRSVTEQLGFSLYEALPSETQWLNEAVDRLWEYIEQAIRKLLQEDITKKIREDSEQSLLKTFEFTSCNFGRARPKFGQMKVRSKGNLLEFFLELDWDAPESDIAVSLGSMKLGMQHLKLTGSLLLVFSPLLEKLPLVGGLSVTFPDIPEFSWTWTGSAGLGIRSIAATLDQVMALDINKKIVQAIFEQLVVPNRVYVDIAQLAQERQLPKEERIENYRSPDPIGVLYITIWEARDLPAADISLRGSSSDPYVVVKVGNNSWQTIKRTRTLRPVWGPAHSMDFLVFHMEQHVCVDVFDSDMLSFDDLLGYVCTTNTRRPRISDVIPEVGEEDTREWGLHNKHGKLGGKLKMTCRYRELRDISERAFVEPQWLTCNNCQDPLQESKSLRACSLCGSRPSSQFLRCGSCFSANDARFECAKDNFRCCSQCWQERRPAAAMLRVCLREGLVPADDVLDGAGVALGVKVEGTTQWSAPGVRPTYDNMAEKSEAQRWIRNLCESFDKASVAKCLEISAEQVQEAVNKAKDRDETRASDLIGHEAVIWDHALHFLVRDPHEELQATVIYQGKSRTADQVPLFPKKVRESLRVSRGDRGAARADRRGLPMSEEPLEVTWTINLDSARTASIFADVALHGLLPLGST